MKTLTQSPSNKHCLSEYLATGQPLFIGWGVLFMKYLVMFAIFIAAFLITQFLVTSLFPSLKSIDRNVKLWFFAFSSLYGVFFSLWIHPFIKEKLFPSGYGIEFFDGTSAADGGNVYTFYHKDLTTIENDTIEFLKVEYPEYPESVYVNGVKYIKSTDVP